MSDLNETIIAEEATENEASEETSAEETINEETAEAEITPIPEENAKKKSKTPLIIALCVIVALVVGGLAFAFGSGGDGIFDPLFYTSGNSVYMKDLGTGKKEAKLIYISLYDDLDSDIYLSNVLFNSDLTEALIGIEDMNGTTLYSYDLTSSSASLVKIAENVNDFIKDEATGIITCSIGEESKLVQFDSELKKTVIAEKADYFTVAADGLSAFYSVTEGGTYLVPNGKAAIELTKNGSAEYYDDNLTVFYILEEGSLYKVTAAGERTLIDKNVASTNFGNGDGYYYKTVKTLNIKDLFEDDMAAADNEIKIPEDTDSEAYQLYTDRLTRDEMRAILINPELNYYIQDLYYFDGTESKSILKNVYGDELSYYSASPIESDIATLNCSVIDTSKIKKVRMSELWNVVNNEEVSMMGGLEEVTDLVAEPLTESCVDYFVYKGDFAAEIGIKGIVHSCTLDEKNNAVYVAVSDTVFGDAALYKCPLTNSGLGEAEKICESVNTFDISVTKDGKLFYIEETYLDEETFDSVSKLYFDSKLIADNISYVAEYDLEKGLFVFEKYPLNEDGTPDLEAYPGITVLYDATTGTETVLNTESEEYYCSLYETPEGKTVLTETDYSAEEAIANIYSIDNGKKKLLFSMPDPEFFSYMSIYRDGMGYFEWDDDFIDKDYIDFDF